MLIFAYLFAIGLANLSIAHFGPDAAILNAFLFIGLDLTARDALHERWQHNHLRRNMAALIVSGSVLSWLLNAAAARIALASCGAFALAASADTVVYAILHDRARFVRINGSNVVSSAVDSVTFPALAFGFPLLFGIMSGQFAAKIAGGFIWSIILAHFNIKKTGDDSPKVWVERI